MTATSGKKLEISSLNEVKQMQSAERQASLEKDLWVALNHCGLSLSQRCAVMLKVYKMLSAAAGAAESAYKDLMKEAAADVSPP